MSYDAYGADTGMRAEVIALREQLRDAEEGADLLRHLMEKPHQLDRWNNARAWAKLPAGAEMRPTIRKAAKT